MSFTTAPPLRYLVGAPRRSLCREALPLLGEVARSAEGVARGETGAEWKRKSRLNPAVSFPYWHFLYHGDPSVGLAAASSPKRGAKAVSLPPLRYLKGAPRPPPQRQTAPAAFRSGSCSIFSYLFFLFKSGFTGTPVPRPRHRRLSSRRRTARRRGWCGR